MYVLLKFLTPAYFTVMSKGKPLCAAPLTDLKNGLGVVLHTHASSLNDSDGGIKLVCSLPSSHTVPATKPFQAAHAPCSVYHQKSFILAETKRLSGTSTGVI